MQGLSHRGATIEWREANNHATRCSELAVFGFCRTDKLQLPRLPIGARISSKPIHRMGRMILRSSRFSGCVVLTPHFP